MQRTGRVYVRKKEANPVQLNRVLHGRRLTKASGFFAVFVLHMHMQDKDVFQNMGTENEKLFGRGE